MVNARRKYKRLAYMKLIVCSSDLSIRLWAVNPLHEFTHPEIAHTSTDTLRRPVHDGPAAINIAKISVGDSPTQVFLENDIVKYRSEPSVVSPSRRRRETDVEARPQVVVDFPIGWCQGVVRLIGDNHVEVAGFKFPLKAIRKRLHRSRDYLLTMRVPLGLFYADRAAVVLNWLGHKLLTMG